MEEKKQNKENEELQSRRQFFKEAAKKVLPVVGAIALANMPIVANAATVSEDFPEDCNGSCSYGCGRVCSTGCSNSCSGSCSGGCKGGCYRSCSGSCSGSSKGYRY
ncbi:MAG: hypothetical protein IJ760_06485 [Bacteroidales bacterium]|nr:hypothetical protein [Bacteroidales bacterium]